MIGRGAASAQVLYFALPDELREAIARVEAELVMTFAPTGLFGQELVPLYHSLLELPTLGRNAAGDINFADSFLALPRETRLKVRSVPQYGGGTKYAVDQQINPASIVLVLGGVFGEEALIAGKVGTTSPASMALYKSFRAVMLAGFRSIKGWYLGRGAVEWLHAGKRLTVSVQSPKEYDLTPDP